MKSFPPALAAAALLAFCCLRLHAQNAPALPMPPSGPQQPATTASLQDALLARATNLYASTAKWGLRGFDCSVHPDWERMQSSSRKSAPAAGDDPALALLKSVRIALHAQIAGETTLDWQVPADKQLDARESALLERAHRDVAQTLDGALKLWSPLVDGSIAASLGAEDADIRATENGYSVISKDKKQSLTKEFDRGLVLKRSVIADSGSIVDIAPTFAPSSQGLLVSGFEARVQPGGGAGHSAQEMHISFDYQTISGAQIPAHVDVNVPGVVEMDFALDGCTVNPQ